MQTNSNFKYLVGLATLSIWLTACDPLDEMPAENTRAYVPVYHKSEDVYKTTYSAARAMSRPGKQYVYGNLLLQTEQNEGIHLIDISTPSSPRKIGFLEIPLCTEMSVKQGYLYANNFDDIVVIDLAAAGGPKLVKRLKKVFTPPNQEYPPFFNVAFECVDPAKGIVTDWVLKDSVSKANCRR
ncbi:MAG TPA: hypothetical protein VLC98_14000 [Phnomibacter sp.]|nr:hypothetical protein [Phnomibacter sp.]